MFRTTEYFVVCCKEYAQLRPQLFARYIPNVLPPCSLDELDKYVQEAQQMQRDLLTHPDFFRLVSSGHKCLVFFQNVYIVKLQWQYACKLPNFTYAYIVMFPVRGCAWQTGLRCVVIKQLGDCWPPCLFRILFEQHAGRWFHHCKSRYYVSCWVVTDFVVFSPRLHSVAWDCS